MGKLGVELCNLAEAECREERRWMERENAKEGRRIKQAETDRIARLVKLADMHDPRMIAERERKKAEKEAVAAAKLATAEAARLEKEAKAKAAEEERLAKERQEAEKRRIDKEKKEEAKRAVRNSRQRVRKLHADASVCSLTNPLWTGLQMNWKQRSRRKNPMPKVVWWKLQEKHRQLSCCTRRSDSVASFL